MSTSILDRIFAARRAALVATETAHPLAKLRARVEAAPPARSFAAALRDDPYGLIAEVKKGSPSRGIFDSDLDPVAKATAYAAGGASAISVVTEPEFFYGDLTWLSNIRAQVDLPLLRKDFIFAPYQIWEARAAGADAVLLIVAMLEDRTAGELMAVAAEAGLECLVEVHNEAEARRAGAWGGKIVGVNNRDLKSFAVTLETSERLIDYLPADAVKVSESGIASASDCTRLAAAGYDAFLIGESLVTADDPAAKLKNLRGVDA